MNSQGNPLGAASERFCNKCGYFGPDAIHHRPSGGGCNYLSAASQPRAPACTIAPEGWQCTRTPGHNGPCAAIPVKEALADATPAQPNPSVAGEPSNKYPKETK